MNNIINWHKSKYPLIQEQDIYKLVYQSFFASGHMIENKVTSLEYLENEMNSLDDIYQDLYEEIGNGYVRLNLRPFKKYNLSIDYLNDAFVQSAKVNNPLEDFNKLIDKLGIYNFKDNVHHSIIYKDNYKPNYRVINKEFINDDLKYYQIHNFISNLKPHSIVSLEGKCASGKTTITEKLKRDLNITVINVDDFFLPIERKTEERLNEVGGNIDYERIRALLLNLKFNSTILFEKFNCSIQKYEKECLEIKDIVILEGVYSYHKYFRRLIDKLIYIDIKGDLQLNRLRSRSNFNRFVSEWIPLENRYFDLENIKYLADLII